MSLFNEHGKEITEVSHLDFFNRYYGRLDLAQQRAIDDTIDTVLDSGRIHTTSWVPGPDWRGTAYQPIFEVACSEDWHRARLLYGLIFMRRVIARDEDWYCGRYPRTEDEIIGLTYWRPTE